MTQIATHRNCPIPNECNAQNRCLLAHYPCGRKTFRAATLFGHHPSLEPDLLDARIAEGDFSQATAMTLTDLGIADTDIPDGITPIGITFTDREDTGDILCTLRFVTSHDGYDAVYYSQEASLRMSTAAQLVLNKIALKKYAQDKFTGRWRKGKKANGQ